MRFSSVVKGSWLQRIVGKRWANRSSTVSATIGTSGCGSGLSRAAIISSAVSNANTSSGRKASDSGCICTIAGVRPSNACNSSRLTVRIKVPPEMRRSVLPNCQSSLPLAIGYSLSGYSSFASLPLVQSDVNPTLAIQAFHQLKEFFWREDTASEVCFPKMH